MPRKNLPKPVPHVPIDPDSDLIFSDYSLSDSSDSESGYSKSVKLMCKKNQIKKAYH